jgi:hypothetical protein
VVILLVMTSRHALPAIRLTLSAVAAAAVTAGALAGCSASGYPSATGARSGAATGQAESAARWKAQIPGTGVVGTWTYGGDLVVAADQQITAISQSTGRVAWKLAPLTAPSATTRFCGASTSVVNGDVAVGIGELLPGGRNAECHAVAVVDLRAGRFTWAQSIPLKSQLSGMQGGTAALAPHGIVVGIADNTVVAAWQGVYSGFSLASGARRWTRLVPAASNVSDASIGDIAPAGAVTYLTYTPTFGGYPTLMAIDTATGKARARAGLPQRLTGISQPGPAMIVGTSPVTVVLTDLTSSARALATVNRPLSSVNVIRSGSLNATVAAPGHDLDLTDPADNAAVHGYLPVLSADGMLFAVTVPPDSPPANKLIGYDAATGRIRWTASVPNTDMVAPVAVDGATLIAEGVNEIGHGDPVVVRVNMSTGQVESSQAFSTGGTQQLGGLLVFYGYNWANGSVYAVDWNAATTSTTVPSVLALG